MRRSIDSDKRVLSINNNFIIGLLIMSVVAAILGKVVGVDALASLSFAMSFLLLILLLFFLPSTYRWHFTELLSVEICIFVSLFAVVRNTEVAISFGYIKKWIIFLCTVFMLRISSTAKVSSKTVRIILFLGVASGIILIASYYVLDNKTTYARGITLGFANPNETAIFLLHGILYSLLLFTLQKKWYGKVLCFALMATLLYLIWLTLARSALVSVGVMGVMLIVIGIGQGQIFTKKWMSLAITFLPITFVLLYRLILSSDLVNIFSFMISEGKGLDSRMLTWGPALKLVEQNLLLGDYYTISKGIGVGVSQMHNTGLDVLASYGIVVFCAYHYMLYKSIVRASQKCQNKSQYIALCAFYCIMIEGVFEAAFVSGALGVYLLSCGFLLVASNIQHT